jgi:hypothetical protein
VNPVSTCALDKDDACHDGYARCLYCEGRDSETPEGYLKGMFCSVRCGDSYAWFRAGYSGGRLTYTLLDGLKRMREKP